MFSAFLRHVEPDPHTATIDLPVIPFTVNIDDLDDQYRLVSEEETQRLLAMELPQGHICKSISGCKYVLLKTGSEIHAVYHGKYKLGEGGDGVVKVAQNIHTAKWGACKIASAYYSRDNEFAITDKLHRVIHPPGENAMIYSHTNKAGLKKAAFLFQFFDGKTLTSPIQVIPINPIEYISMIRKCAQSIETLHHDYYITHNDIYAGNIIYDRITGEAAVIDFGNALQLDIETPNDRDFVCLLQSILRESQFNQICLGPLKAKLRSFSFFIEFSLSSFYKLLNELEAGLSVGDKTYKIGLLDISDFDMSSMSQPYSINQYHEIWITDRNHSGTMRDYLKCRQHLIRHHLIVGNKVFREVDEMKLQAAVKEHMEQRHPGCYFDINTIEYSNSIRSLRSRSDHSP